jgi:TRAP-type C4-dicarboxylate transport system permease small subunit
MTGRLRRGSRLLGRIEVVVASVLLAAMVVLVFSDVLMRYVFDAPIRGAGELATSLFVWVVFLGSATAARRRLHVAITWFVEQLPPTPAAIAARAATILIVAILLATAWFGIELMNGSRERTLPLTDIPLRWIYAAVPVGCVLMAIGYCSPSEADPAEIGLDEAMP